MAEQREPRGEAVDLEARSRPGVPMEKPRPQPLPGARVPVEAQHSQVRVFKHAGRKQLPPVYGTAQPPSGLSGVLRGWAYRYPDHWVRHWMMLLVADRVDVAEHGPRRPLRAGAWLVALLVLGGLLPRLLRR